MTLTAPHDWPERLIVGVRRHVQVRFGTRITVWQGVATCGHTFTNGPALSAGWKTPADVPVGETGRCHDCWRWGNA